MISDQSTIAPPGPVSGTIRWMSPELFDPGRFGLEDSRPTTESDCYALGMVMYEVLSGQAPYARCVQRHVVKQKILEGERPRRPQGTQGAWFTDGLWGILELCWKPRPTDRPTPNTVLLGLRDAARHPRPCANVDRDADDRLATASDPRMCSPFHLGPTPN